MIISRTPYRISFFGGGTDYQKWYREHGGAVLAMAFNKYCYISMRHLPPFFDHKHRIVYSDVELVNEVEEIRHPAIRAVLLDKGVDRGLEIHCDNDLPARSGLGSSSAFTAGLLNAYHAMKGETLPKPSLAREAMRMEQEVLRENVGSQDQVTTVYGGFNRIDFHRDDTVDVSPVILPRERLQEFQSSLLLVYSGISRFSSNFAKGQIDNMEFKEKELHTMRQLVDEGLSILTNEREPIERFGELLDESWKLKRSLTDSVSNEGIDRIYEAAIEAGASGGKLMGAGGGGFMIFIVRPALRHLVREKLKDLIQVNIRIDYGGSKIVVYDPEDHGSGRGYRAGDE